MSTKFILQSDIYSINKISVSLIFVYSDFIMLNKVLLIPIHPQSYPPCVICVNLFFLICVNLFSLICENLLFCLVHNLIHYLYIRFRPVEGSNQVHVHPFRVDMFGQGQVACRAGTDIGVQGQFKVRVSVLGSQERTLDGDVHQEFFTDFTDESLFGGFMFLYLAARKFVSVGGILKPGLVALYTQYFVIHYNNSCYHFNVLHCNFLSAELKIMQLVVSA